MQPRAPPTPPPTPLTNTYLRLLCSTRVEPIPHSPCLPCPPWMVWCSAAGPERRDNKRRGGGCGRGGRRRNVREQGHGHGNDRRGCHRAVEPQGGGLTNSQRKSHMQCPAYPLPPALPRHTHAALPPPLRLPHPAAPARAQAPARRRRRPPARAQCWPGGARGRRPPQPTCPTRQRPRCAASPALSARPAAA